MEGCPLDRLFISVLSLGELTKGIVLILERDTQRAEFYRDWLLAVREQYKGRTLAIDALVAETWGVMASTGALALPDALLAATARAHGLTLATRNRRDFSGLGIQVFSPWTD